MPGVVSLLSLLECCLNTADETDVFVDDDAERQNVLLRLAVVELANADLNLGEAI